MSSGDAVNSPPTNGVPANDAQADGAATASATASGGASPTITFYTRKQCHLCDDALRSLETVRTETAFELEVVDLDHGASAEKRAAYDWEVPVVELNGRKIMKYTVDAARLRRLLASV